MKRLYYLADTLETTRNITAELHRNDVADSNYFVVSHDDAGLVCHNIHPANPIEQLDIIHSGEQGAILGFLGGVILMSGIHIWQPFPEAVGIGVSLLVVVLVTMFGAWVGGFVGVSHDNYKIARFHQAIAAGKYLVVVEVSAENEDQIQHALSQFGKHVTMEGVDNTVVNPLEGFPFQRLKSVY